MKWMILSQKKLEQIIEARVTEALAEENANYEKEMLLKQANLLALQSQINPHFLYKTLECIRGMALMEEKENIADIAWSLSRFFRYSISGKSNVVTLREEMANCDTYIKIQNYRFQNRFALETQFSPDVEDCLLPKLTLQPVVENAVLHGLQNTLSGGVIRILVERVGRDVRIVISDNGCGMPPEKLEELTEHIHNGSAGEGSGHHNGIAMYNVNRRLNLFFGQEYGVSVRSCLGMGTDIELRIPYRVGKGL